MKILLATSIFPPGGGGAAAVYHHLCRQLPREMVVMAPASGDGREEAFDRVQGYTVMRVGQLGIYRARRGPAGLRKWMNIGMRLWSRVPAAWSLMRAVRKHKPDVLCIGTLETLYWMGPLARLLGCGGVVFYIHGEEVSSIESMGAVSRWFFRRSVAAMKRADRVIGVSRWTCDRIEALGVDGGKVELIPNGVEHERFYPGKATEAFLEEKGLAGKRVLLTVARLDARKGHETVLKALPGVSEKISDLVYVIVGDGPERAKLEKLAKSLGVAEQVIFAGRVTDEELRAYYHACDVFVQPNRRMPDGDDEGFGLVFIEAGACGKPVIGGRSGGVPEAVMEGITGLLVDGHSAKETEAALIRVLSDGALAEVMGGHGIVRASALDWQRTGRAFRQACEVVARASDKITSDNRGGSVSLPAERSL